MRPHAILARLAIAAVLGLACASPSQANKWVQIDGVWKFIDDLAAAGKSADGAAIDAANAGRKIDLDDLPTDGGKKKLRPGEKVDDGAGKLAARAPVNYDKFIPEGAADAAVAGKNVPTAVLQVDNAKAGGGGKAVDIKDWDNLPNVQFNPLNKLRNNAGKVDAPPASNYLLFDPKLIKPGNFVDANELPSVGTLVRRTDEAAAQADNAAASSSSGLRKNADSADAASGKLNDAVAISKAGFNDFLDGTRKASDDIIAKGDRELDEIFAASRKAFDETPAPRLQARAPQVPVKAVKNGAGWSKRQKVVVGTGTTAIILVAGGTTTYVLYETYAPATEKLDAFADSVRDVGKQDARLTVSNFTNEEVKVFEVLFNSRNPIATLAAQEKDKEILVKIGDKIEIDKSGSPFTKFSMSQDEDILVQ